MSLFWFWLYAYSILYNMAIMWWCWILGKGGSARTRVYTVLKSEVIQCAAAIAIVNRSSFCCKYNVFILFLCRLEMLYWLLWYCFLLMLTILAKNLILLSNHCQLYGFLCWMLDSGLHLSRLHACLLVTVSKVNIICLLIFR